MAAGNFTASVIPQMVTALDVAWTDAKANQKNAINEPSVATLKAIIENDTASKKILGAAKGCQSIKLTWLESNDANATIGTQSDYASRTCEIDGEQAESLALEVNIDKVVKDSTFKVADDNCGNMFDLLTQASHIALVKQREILEVLAKAGLDFLHASAGVDAYKQGIAYNGATSTTTKIAKGNFNYFDIFPHFALSAEMNRFKKPYILDGINLWSQYAQALGQKNTNAGDVGAANFFAMMPTYFDPRNFIAQSMATRTFMADRGAVAFVPRQYSQAELTTKKELTGSRMAYVEPLLGSLEMLGVQLYLDVLYDKREVDVENDGNCKLYHIWEYKLFHKFVKNPSITGDTGTGIIEFVRDDAGTQVCVPQPVAC